MVCYNWRGGGDYLKTNKTLKNIEKSKKETLNLCVSLYYEIKLLLTTQFKILYIIYLFYIFKYFYKKKQLIIGLIIRALKFQNFTEALLQSSLNMVNCQRLYGA